MVHSMRMVLRQQIREKDAMIDNVLSQVNPGPTNATPLTLVPARLPLNPKERNDYRDVLAYLERAAQQAGQRFMGDGRTKFDISALEDVMSEDESGSEGDGTDGGHSPKRDISPKTEGVHAFDTVLEMKAPTGIMAAAAFETNRKAAAAPESESGSASSGSQVDAGVAGEQYFLPGTRSRYVYLVVQLTYSQQGPQADLQMRRLIVERQAAPDILLSGLVTPEDATALFGMCVYLSCWPDVPST